MRNPLLFLVLALPNLAFGQSWSGFDAVTPAFPCQDGWMGCLQDGEAVNSELQRDGAGMPVPADLRLGWFDLEPTSNFSPFSKLSSYPEGPVPRISDEPDPGPVAANTDDATDPDGAVAEPEPVNDAVADGFMDPEAERARQEAEQRKLEEAEMRRAQQRAAEEAERARREEERRKREADDQARRAQKAMEAVQQAANAAERARAEAEAKRAEEDRKRAAAAAAEAEKLRQQREEQERAKAKAAAEAAEQARKAEEDRKRKEAEEARKADQARKEEEARRKAAEEEARKAAEAARLQAEKAEAERLAAAEKARKEAEAAAAAAKSEEERKRLEAAQAKAEAEQKAAAEEAKRKAAEAAKKAAEEARRKAEEEEQRRQAERLAQQEAEKQRIAAEQQAKKDAEDAAKAGEDAVAGGGDEGECSDLVQLETKAVLGKLGAPTVKCLEDRLAASTRQTEKSKVSRLLMGNAFATDKSEWERLMKRHLEEIDQSDPDLCYKYAIQLVKKGPGSAYEVIKWADVALENRAVWTGSTYQKRVYSLYKVRTAAANKLWMNFEAKQAANPTDENNEKLKDARNRTKVFAREWYEYAKAADKDTTEALNMCQSAAGTKKYCEAG
jgi:hypothetical protein